MRTAKRVGRLAVVVALLAAVAGTAGAAEYLVNPAGTGDYPTIQAAVLAATDGDTILLADGTFTGDGNRDIQVPSRSIIIRSENYDYNNCIIDCDGSARAEHRGFRFTADVGTGDAMLYRVSIINGYTTSGGGGILIEGANPEIRECAIEMCTVEGPSLRGGGVYVADGADPDFFFCLISQNTADYGGGIALFNAGGNYFSCEIYDNTATNTGGGVYIQSTESIVFNYCNIVSNTAQRAGGVRTMSNSTAFYNDNISRNEATSGHSGGVWLQGGVLSNCTIVANSATTGGGGVYCAAGSGNIYYSIIAFTEDGYGLGADEGVNIPNIISCCDVYGNVDGNYDSVIGDQTGFDNNFSADPEFCDFNNGDYRLFDTSPCLATTSPCSHSVGRWGQACDTPVEKTSWGVLKAMWR